VNETAKNREEPRAGEFEDARLGYQTMASLVGLVSQEIYSRFGAMLIVHGLLLTVVFRGEENDFIRVVATIAGLFLCPLWLVMLEHGFFYQHFLREKAKNLEERYFKPVFTVFLSLETPEEDLTVHAAKEPSKQSKALHRLRRMSARHDVEVYGIIVVALFFAVYAVMLWRILSTDQPTSVIGGP